MFVCSFFFSFRKETLVLAFLSVSIHCVSSLSATEAFLWLSPPSLSVHVFVAEKNGASCLSEKTFRATRWCGLDFRLE